MARKIRITEPGFYHIVSRGNLKSNIFESTLDYEKFLSLISNIKKDFNITIHSFCLMTNHYHILLETHEKNISKAIHNLNNTYAKYFNKKYKKVGHLFQSRFFSSLLYDEVQALQVAKYIERNPITAYMVKNIIEYPYQSFYIIKKKTSNINIIENSIIFNINLNDYEKFINKDFTEEIISSIYETPKIIIKADYMKILYKKLSTFFENNFLRNENIKKAFEYGYSKVEIATFLNLNRSTISKITK